MTTLSDAQLEQIFEVNATKSKLREDEKALQRQIETYTMQQTQLLEAATQFSHPVYVLRSKAN